MVGEAVREAVEACSIEQVRAGRPERQLLPAVEHGRDLTYLAMFQGCYAGNGDLSYTTDQFCDELVPRPPLAELRAIGAVIRHTLGFQTRHGCRRQQASRCSFRSATWSG